MPRQFFSGNSIEQAVMSAARHYQIDPELLAYKLRDKKHGFLNIRRRVVIEVDPENLEKSAAPPVAEAPPERVVNEDPPPPSPAEEEGDGDAGPAESDADSAEEEGSEETSDGVGDTVEGEDGAGDSDEIDDEGPHDDRRGSRGRGRRGGRGADRHDRKRQRRRDVDIKEFQWNGDDDGWSVDDVEEGESQEMAAVELCVERILDVMDLEIEYTITDGDVMEIEFSGEDSEYLVEDNGKVLKAIEHIVPRTVRGLIGRSVSVNADCDGFRADHEDSLRQAAVDLAREVSQSGKPKSMSPMNPADRRIVHLTATPPGLDLPQPVGASLHGRLESHRNRHSP
ncbi:MAG: R3H domain-containing nucleic acid-binding protein, partial [Acidobacteriota bacterium]